MGGLYSTDVLPSGARADWDAAPGPAGLPRVGGGRQLPAGLRWVLLLAVVAGLFGMHVLTAETATGGHGALPRVAEAGHLGHGFPGGQAGEVSPSAAVPTAMPAGMPAAHDVTVGGEQRSGTVAPTAGPATVPAQDPEGTPAGHGGLGGCILFLVIGGAAVLLRLLSGRAHADLAGTVWTATARWGRWRRRGPPGRNRPRVALCVIRV